MLGFWGGLFIGLTIGSISAGIVLAFFAGVGKLNEDQKG